MTHPETKLDCRGLPAAIAVLRIKQALHCAQSDAPRVLARLSKECGLDRVMAGLQAEESSVRLVSAG